MKRFILIFLIVNLIFTKITAADDLSDTTDTGKRIYRTVRLQSSSPFIDGQLDDACWEEGSWTGHFKQFMPTEGAEESQKTEMKILYDNRNIYVAFKAYDTEPDKIDFQRGRRDNFTGDIVGICFDSYLDYRTGFGFYITAAGIKIDLLVLNSGDDASWDAVWQGKVGRDENGWTAEMEIPLSQLRYGNREEHIWGLHAWRWLNRTQEATHWNLIPRDHSGPLYYIGEMHGIKGIAKARNVELLPYTVGKIKTFEKAENNPYLTGQASNLAFGLDGKIGISSDFTMDFTINPDFGQVEADPAELNLTAYETFYNEKRPFFLEGKNIMDFDLGGSPLFYSRRIGQSPSYSPNLGDNEYAERLENTSILGAIKFSGKNKEGLSVGIVESLTAREEIEITSGAEKYEEVAEPLTNYFVGRVQKDFNKSNTLFGGMFTSTNRFFDQPYLNSLNRTANTGGLDFKHHWKDKEYYLEMKSVFSHITGNEAAITSLQRSSSRYYYRPDADHLSPDTNATELTGYGGEIEIGKARKGNWRYNAGINWRSPGLELNDIGYLQTADEIYQDVSVSYVENKPSRMFRRYNFSLGQGNYWNFGGNYLYAEEWFGFEFTLNNNWGFGGNNYWMGDNLDTRVLRGGPAITKQGLWCQSYYIYTDGSKKLSFNLNYHFHINQDKLSAQNDFSPGLTLRITDAFSFSTNINYSVKTDNFQYVSEYEENNEPAYLLATLDRKTLGMTMRMDFTITPDLTIQYYVNPYISVGNYLDYKKITNAESENYDELYHIFTSGELVFNGEENSFNIPEASNTINGFTFDNPDFIFSQLRSNLVARWEYKPGSTVYLVWTHGRFGHENSSDYSIERGIDKLFENYPENVFLVKFNYWFGI